MSIYNLKFLYTPSKHDLRGTEPLEITPNIAFIFCGLVSLMFLIYSLLNMKKLTIGITHPRIIVELILFLLFTLIGIYLNFR